MLEKTTPLTLMYDMMLIGIQQQKSVAIILAIRFCIIDSCFAVDWLERPSTFGFFVHLTYIIT